MNDLIRTEKLFGGNKIIIGSPSSDLILESLGKIYIKTGKSTQLLDKVIQSLIQINDKELIIISNDIELPYPGDGKLIFNPSNNILYICIDGEKLELIEASGKEGNYVKKSGDRMSGTLYLDNKDPLRIQVTSLIKNLNSEYLDGYKADALAKKHEDEVIDGKWIFEALQRFKDKVIIDKSIGTESYQDGYQGYGWKIDSKSNTLTIDNIIVRKSMQVFELVVNKIRATNGTLWITNSATIEEVTAVSEESNNDNWHFSEDRQNIIKGSEQYPIHFSDNEKLWTEKINYITTVQDYKNKLLKFESDGEYQSYIIYDKFFKNSNSYYIIKTDEFVFLEGDLIRCQKLIKSGIKYYDAVVIRNIKYDEYLIQLSENTEIFKDFDVSSNDKENEQDYDIYMLPQKTDVLVQFGNIFNVNRQGTFYITSSEINSPYAMVISGCNRPNYNEPYSTPIFNEDGSVKQENNKYKYEWVKSIKVRVGKLDGQWDNFYLDENGNSPIHGWGLYGQDVYLTGEFHLNNGKTVVDFAQEGILMKFKNAGLEIKDIIDDSVQPQNGWSVQMYPQYADSSKIKDLDPRLLEFEEGIPKYYTHLGVKYTLTKPGVYYQADCNLDEFNWFIMIQEGESKWNTNKQGIILTADQVKIVNKINGENHITALFKDGYLSSDLIKATKIQSINKIGDYLAWSLNEDGSGNLCGNSIHWNKDGDMSIKNVNIEGFFGQPFKYMETLENNNSFNDIIEIISDPITNETKEIDRSEDFKNGNILLVHSNDAILKLPFNTNMSGKIVRISSAYDKEGLLNVGVTRINAPEKMWFFENGVKYNSISISREFIELIGYGTEDVFFGYVVLSRNNFMTQNSYGSLFYFLGSLYCDDGSIIYQKTFDKTTFTSKKLSDGYYTITLPSEWTFHDTNDIGIILSPMGIKNQEAKLYASIVKIENNTLFIQTADDASLNSGKFQLFIYNNNQQGYFTEADYTLDLKPTIII